MGWFDDRNGRNGRICNKIGDSDKQSKTEDIFQFNCIIQDRIGYIVDIKDPCNLTTLICKVYILFAQSLL